MIRLYRESDESRLVRRGEHFRADFFNPATTASRSNGRTLMQKCSMRGDCQAGACWSESRIGLEIQPRPIRVDPIALLHGWNNLKSTDPGGSQNSPNDLFHRFACCF
ncbi:MAG: hypothetical protein DMG14_06730 [Acidobacteria bacterium]|nr:MAG: hypothetical protein DMG14_06730 [Acidobacteriota bacterium]